MAERRFYPPTVSDIPMHGWKPYSDFHRERIRAHSKHDPNGGSMERRPFDDPLWLPVLLEEVGEVARALCENNLGTEGYGDRSELAERLREELIQVGAMTAAWIDAIERDEGFGSVIDVLSGLSPRPGFSASRFNETKFP